MSFLWFAYGALLALEIVFVLFAFLVVQIAKRLPQPTNLPRAVATYETRA